MSSDAASGFPFLSLPSIELWLPPYFVPHVKLYVRLQAVIAMNLCNTSIFSAVAEFFKVTFHMTEINKGPLQQKGMKPVISLVSDVGDTICSFIGHWWKKSDVVS
jgi:hypothetical protein